MLSKSTTYAIYPAAFVKGRINVHPVVRTVLMSSLDRSHRDRRDVIERKARDRPITALLPIMVVVLIAFLIIGLALPVLPLHVHHGLGLSTFVVGLVTGSQFAASLMSRVWSGHYR